MSFVQGAALYLNYATAWYALHRLALTPEETVLVQGAAGGVGTAALELFEGRSIAVVSSDEKERAARAMGADEVVRSTGDWLADVRALTDGRGVQGVVDTVGGDRFLDSIRSLAIGGSLAVVGFTGGSIPELKVNRLLLRNLTVHGVEMVAMDKEYPGDGGDGQRGDRAGRRRGPDQDAGRRDVRARRGRRRAAAPRSPRGDRQGRGGGAVVKAVVVSTLDGPDGLILDDFPEPEGAHPLAGDDRLLIEVHAAGVAFPDLLQSRGEYQFATPPPFVTGGEVSGVVVEAPEGSGLCAR